jgi:hypothetical protein
VAPSHLTDSLLPLPSSSPSFFFFLLLPSSFCAGFRKGINKRKLGEDKEGFVDEATGEVTWRITVFADELENHAPPPTYDSNDDDDDDDDDDELARVLQKSKEEQ